VTNLHDMGRALSRKPPADEYKPMLAKEEVSRELRQAIDLLRNQRRTYDEMAMRASRRGDDRDYRDYSSMANGLSSGISALRDALFHLVGEDI